MAILHTVVLTALHLEHHYLLALYERIHHFGYYFSALNGGGTDLHCSIIVYEQHTIKLNSLTGLDVLHVVDEELLSSFSLELLTVNLYDCVHFELLINGFFRKADGLYHHLFKPPRTIIGCKITKSLRHSLLAALFIFVFYEYLWV